MGVTRSAGTGCVLLGLVLVHGLLPAGVLSSVGYGVVGAACAVGVREGISRYRPPGPAGWRPLEVTLWLVALHGPLSVLQQMRPGAGWAAAANVGTDLAANAMALAAAVQFLRARRPGAYRDGLVDAAAVVLAGGLLAWQVSGEGPVGVLVRSRLVPLAGAVLMTATLFAGVRLYLTAHRPRSSLVLLVGAALAMVGNVAVLAASSRSAGPGWVDSAWLAAASSAAVAAQLPDMRLLAEPEPPGHHRPAPGWLRWAGPRARLVVRLVAPVLLVLGLVLALFNWQVPRIVRAQVPAQGLNAQRALAAHLEQVYDGRGAGEDTVQEARELLRRAAAAPEVTQAYLVDAGGQVVAAAGADREGRLDRLDQLAAPTFPDGQPRAVAVTEDGGGYQYVVPVTLGGRPHALQVHQSAAAAEAPLQAIGSATLGLTVISLLLALPLLYLFGGRQLTRHYLRLLARSTTDGLTGLGNHRAFQEQLARQLSVAARTGNPLTLAVLDVDDFKVVNDTYGHARGDETLIAVAVELRRVRAGDAAFRLGGDEFALLLPGADHQHAQRLLDRVRVEVAARTSATVSIGHACADGEDSEPAVLLARADAALYAVKNAGRNGVAYRPAGAGAEARAPARAREVHRLVHGGGLRAVFQPIRDLQAGRVLGYEGLIRLPADCTLAGAQDAFDAAADIGHVAELDAAARAAVLRAAPAVLDGGLLFLNLAPQVLEGFDAADQLHRDVLAAGLRPERVVVELTERATPRFQLLAPQARQLRELGFHLALDDVGAGTNGLETLRRLPVDYVKIDRQVIIDAFAGGPGQAFLAAALAYANAAGSPVIAEGIETWEMLRFIRSAPQTLTAGAVTAGQGHLLGAPTDAPTVAPTHEAPQHAGHR